MMYGVFFEDGSLCGACASLKSALELLEEFGAFEVRFDEDEDFEEWEEA